jgi:hypothetical protein
MCSILCWILYIWEALGWKFCIFGLIHALPTRGGVWAWNGLLDAFRRFSGGFEPFLGSGVHRSDRSRSPVWPSECWSCAHVEHRFDRWWWPIRPVKAKLLQLPCFKWCFACIRPGGCIGSGGACMCAGGALCGCSSFGLVVCALCLSIVLSRMCRAIALA